MFNKVFCIGMNKTGTTSMKFEFERLGYRVANQNEFEKTLNLYKSNKFDTILDYCKNYDFFQDFPFSFPKTYRYIDNQFPNSKYILTVRDSAEQWYESLVRFHSMTSHIKSNGKLPTAYDLKSSEYVNKGWLFDAHTMLFNVTEEDLYNKDKLIKVYEDYNKDVMDYFGDRDDFMVLNLNEVDSYEKFKNFLGIKSSFDRFPHKNKSI